uniref:Isoleucyl-tRNA synthetase n=1 Tax=Lygus hesperus TaxID=30085 RepID=A0A146L1W0_LYGHE
MVDEDGHYTCDAGNDLSGLNVLREGNEKILNLLRENILHKEVYVHSYPYDWRTNRPVIIRSSLQWFIDTNSIKTAAIDALQKVEILPTRNVEGMIAQMERRPYWCISRQRSWGVPIPVLYDSDQPVINSELIDHYKCLALKHGADFWWTLPLDELIPKALRNSLDPETLSKGQDILDIWLDSGLSWSSVLGGKTADVYLEGVDQFTGWFQSSLITSVALQGKAPFSKVIVHGFAVDETGRKMSKSLGNVVDPQFITRGGPNLKQDTAYGVDVLRWWVASHGLQHTTISISNRLLEECADNIKRLRNSLKFLMGSIDDFPEYLVLDPPPLSTTDKYFLLLLQEFESRINDFYRGYQYNRVCTAINNFVSNDLSSFYCHVTKDKLYCDGSKSNKRKAVQYVMYHALNTLTKAFGPIMPILAEELYSYHPHRTDDSSPYFFEFDKLQPIHLDIDNVEKTELKSCFQLVKAIKENIFKEMPINLKSSELKCILTVDSPTYDSLKLLQEDGESVNSDLTAILQVSTVILNKDEGIRGYSIEARATDHSVCDRCRRFCVEDSNDEICDRCKDVLEVLPTVNVSSI